MSAPPHSAKSAAWYATLLLIPLVTAAALLWLYRTQNEKLARREVGRYGTVPEFALTNQDGRRFGSADLKGEIWIADFVFTNCAGPCPMISSRMSELQKPLRDTDVHLVTFTVDPERDTPAVLKEYAAKLDAAADRWDFLTGSAAAIYDLTRSGFKLAVAEGTEDSQGPVHSTRAVLVDRSGTIRGYYDMLQPDSLSKLVADSRNLLREQPPARR